MFQLFIIFTHKKILLLLSPIIRKHRLKINKKILTITVYVSGEVNSPGLVELPSDSRIADAIKACGDFTPLADKTKINLAQKLTDGMQIQVSSKTPVNNSNEQVNDTNSNSPNNNSSSNLININTATKRRFRYFTWNWPCNCSKNHRLSPRTW